MIGILDKLSRYLYVYRPRTVLKRVLLSFSCRIQDSLIKGVEKLTETKRKRNQGCVNQKDLVRINESGRKLDRFCPQPQQ